MPRAPSRPEACHPAPSDTRQQGSAPWNLPLALRAPCDASSLADALATWIDRSACKDGAVFGRAWRGGKNLRPADSARGAEPGVLRALCECRVWLQIAAAQYGNGT